MVAAVCIAAAGMGGMKAYNVSNQSETNVLLAENVEALCATDGLTKGEGTIHIDCISDPTHVCWLKNDHMVLRKQVNLW